MNSIAELLAQAQLPDSGSPRLDAELLLAHVLDKPRSYLRTWPEQVPSAEQIEHFKALLTRRCAGEPVAYLLGQRGFWNLDLKVTPSTLIPRPDTELLVEQALRLGPAEAAKVLDLGTGTGAIALALASERPQWQVFGCDRVAEAVALAEENRQRLGIGNANFVQSDWFAQLPLGPFALIVSNPPYIAADDPHLQQGDVRFEPHSALVSGNDGLDDIRRIVSQARRHLAPGGWLLLEHGWQQAAAVRALLAAAGFTEIGSWRDLGGHERVSGGRVDG